jgi:hypothetical protein
MTSEFSGHIALRLCRIAALEHKNHKNNYALCLALRQIRRTLHTRKPIRHKYSLTLLIINFWRFHG